MKLYLLAYSVVSYACPPLLGYAPDTVKTIICSQNRVVKIAGGYPTPREALRGLEVPSGRGTVRYKGLEIESFQLYEQQGARLKELPVSFKLEVH